MRRARRFETMRVFAAVAGAVVVGVLARGVAKAGEGALTYVPFEFACPMYEQVVEIAAGGVTIVVVEQFAHEVLGVADRAAIMLSGSIRRIGPPAEIAEELEAAYLSGTT